MPRTFLLLFLISVNYIFSQSHIPYKLGEKCSYSIYFGPIEVGTGELEVVENTKINKTNTLHIVGKGKTNRFFDLFFKVRDTYETYINVDKLVPIKFIRKVNEGGHIINQRYNFFHDSSFVVTQDSTFKKTDLKHKKSFFVPIFMDNENYMLEIMYLYNEIIETKWGKINCIVFKPKMQEGRVFEDGEQMKVWISDDTNHILMKVETKIWAGTIKALLTDYKFLKKPLSIITPR